MIFSNKDGYNDHQVQLIVVTSFCLISSTIAVALRLIARRQFGIKLWWDDYIAVLALIFSYFPNILTLLGLGAGLGRHVSEVTPEGAMFIAKTVMVHQFTWWIAYNLIIITILILYIRLFPNTWLRKTSIWVGVVVTIWTVLNDIIIIFQCTPIKHFWIHNLEGGTCIKQNQYYAVAATISMVMIIAVFCLPLPIVWKLQVSAGRRWGLVVAFAVGAFACVSSIMRLILVLQIDDEDQTWTIATPILWGCLEVSIGVVSACIPSLMPLFLMLSGKRRRADTKGQSYTRYASDKSGSKQSSKFNRMLSLGAPEPLPEGVELSHLPDDPRQDDNDDVRLVEAGKHQDKIVVTNQISQVSQTTVAAEDALSHRKAEDGSDEAFSSWSMTSPAPAHVSRHA